MLFRSDAESIDIFFFHFSKSLFPNNYSEGLFPLHLIKNRLLDEIFELIRNVVNYEDWKQFIYDINTNQSLFGTSSLRLNNDDGPNGFLIREFGETSQRGHVFYLSNSEFIDDVIKSIQYKFRINIKEIYESQSKKCVVKFVVRNIDKKKYIKYITEAVNYLYFKNNGEDIEFCCIAYFARGNPVLSEDIVSVEVLK